MTLATVGAFALMDFDEGAAVMLFFQVGELFQSIAVERSRRSVAALMDLRPDVAVVLRDGEAVECDPEEVEVGDLLAGSAWATDSCGRRGDGGKLFRGHGQDHR